jgi:carbon-monoxide dehydrogenase medium subunit
VAREPLGWWRVKPAPVAYERPSSVEEAIELLAEHGDEAKVLAGGQSLVPLLNMRLARPAVLVDINHVVDLDNHRGEDGSVGVGAAVRQRDVGPLARIGALCLPFVGHYVTRNRGTVGGSIAHADARAELPLALLVHGGSAVAASADGRRTIAAADLFVTHFTTSLEPTELLVETLWPSLEGWGCAFEELALRAGDFALAMAAAAVRCEDGRVVEARIGIGATVDRPTLLEHGLLRAPVTEAAARELGALAAARAEPTESIHASVAYQRHLTGLVVERAVLRAWREAPGGGA